MRKSLIPSEAAAEDMAVATTEEASGAEEASELEEETTAVRMNAGTAEVAAAAASEAEIVPGLVAGEEVDPRIAEEGVGDTVTMSTTIKASEEEAEDMETAADVTDVLLLEEGEETSEEPGASIPDLPK